MYATTRFVSKPLSLCCLMALASGCHYAFGPALRGSGIAETEDRNVGPFTEIEVGGGMQCDVTVGEAPILTVTADDNILPLIRTEVSGERLAIFVDASYSTSIGVQVKATVPELRALHGSGAAKTTVTGLAGKEFRLDLSGASTCQLSGEVSEFEAQLSGASHGDFVGSAEQLAIDCSGASHVNAAEFPAKNVVVSVSGASSARVHATGSLAATASGASNVRFAGQPANLVENTSGASDVSPE